LYKNLFVVCLFIILLQGCKKDLKKPKSLTQRNDSLYYFFDSANNDSLSYEKRQYYNRKAISIIATDRNDSMNRINYFKIANRYFNMNAMDDYKLTTELIVQKSEQAKDSISLAKAYSYLGDYYGGKFISDSAYGFYFKAEKIYKALKDDSKTARALLNKSVLQFNEKDYIGSEKSVFDALKYLRKTDNYQLTYEANNLLGVIYNELTEYDK